MNVVPVSFLSLTPAFYHTMLDKCGTNFLIFVYFLFFQETEMILYTKKPCKQRGGAVAGLFLSTNMG